MLNGVTGVSEENTWSEAAIFPVPVWNSPLEEEGIGRKTRAAAMPINK